MTSAIVTVGSFDRFGLTMSIPPEIAPKNKKGHPQRLSQNTGTIVEGKRG
jgi:hypothetical protein